MSARLDQAPGPAPDSMASPTGSMGEPGDAPVETAAILGSSRCSSGTVTELPSASLKVLGSGMGQPLMVAAPMLSDSIG